MKYLFLETTVANSNSCINITDLLSITLAIIGIIIALLIYYKQRKDDNLRRLAQQIALFYKEEELLIDEIKKCRDALSQNTKSTSVKAIKDEFRKKISDTNGLRITETDKSVARYY